MGEITDYDEGYPDPHKIRDRWRVAWRGMAASTGFRTLYPSLIPPRTAHVHGVFSAAGPTNLATVWAGTVASALPSDFSLRAVVGTKVSYSHFDSLPCPPISDLSHFAIRKFLHLNCTTKIYAPLWEELTGEDWTPAVPLRNAWARREAQADIDVIVSMLLGLTEQELGMIYRTQFPVMRRYDREDFYDHSGRKVPDNIARLERKLKPGESLSWAQRSYTHPQSGVSYALTYPFKTFDYESHTGQSWGQYRRVRDLMAPSSQEMRAA